MSFEDAIHSFVTPFPTKMNKDKYELQNLSLKKGILFSILPNIIKFYRGNGVVDIGSNTGMFIECFLEHFPNAQIIAFEPVKRYFDYSIEKFKDKENIIIENFALSDEEKEDEIFVAEINIGWNTLIKEKVDADNAGRKEKIRSICFDRYYEENRIGKVDILKIDTEGFEYKVIKGMKKFLKEQKPAIVCEIGWGCNHPHWNEELEAFDYLYSIGYSRSREDYIRGLKETTDVVFE